MENPGIRVLVADVPGLLAHTLADEIEAQPDMVLVGRAEGSLEILLEAAWNVDVVILGAESAEVAPGLVSHLLGEFPHLKILTLSRSQDLMVDYWLDIRCGQALPVSSASLLGKIRQLYQRTPTE